MPSVIWTPLLAFLGLFGWAIYTADPNAISVGLISPSAWTEHNGYNAKTLSVMFQGQLLAIERTVRTKRGAKYESEDKVRNKAMDVMTDTLSIDKPIKAIQMTFGMIPLEVGGSLVEKGKDFYLYITAYSSDGKIYKIKRSVTGIENLDTLMRDGALGLMEEVDPFIVADYWFRIEKPSRNFVNTRRYLQKGLIQDRPQDAAWYYNLDSQVLALEGKYEESITRCQKAIELDPANSRYYLHWAEALAGLGRFDEALQQLAIAQKIKPGDADIYSYRGVVFTKQGNDLKAQEAYAEALAVNPHHAESYYRWSQVLHKVGRTGDAIEALRRAVFLDKDNEDLDNDDYKVALDALLAETDPVYRQNFKANKQP